MGAIYNRPIRADNTAPWVRIPPPPFHGLRKAVSQSSLVLDFYSLIQLGNRKCCTKTQDCLPARSRVSVLRPNGKRKGGAATCLKNLRAKGAESMNPKRLRFTLHFLGKEIFSLSIEWIRSNPVEVFELAAHPLPGISV